MDKHDKAIKRPDHKAPDRRDKAGQSAPKREEVRTK